MRCSEHVTVSNPDECIKVNFNFDLNLKSTGIRRGLYTVCFSVFPHRAWDALILARQGFTLH